MSNYDYFVGIDPGLTGGVVVLDSSKSISNYMLFEEDDGFIKRDTVHKISDFLKNYKSDKLLVAIEKVHGMPFQSSKSTFKFGRIFGYLEASINSLKLDYALVSPMTWTKFYHKTLSFKKDDNLDSKKKTLMYLSQHYKDVIDKFTIKVKRTSKFRDGLGDAFLIAAYLVDNYKTNKKLNILKY